MTRSISKSVLLILAALLLSSCATLETPYSRWNRITADPQYKAEKSAFNERLNGKQLCPDMGVASFTANGSTKPDAKCLYPDIRIARINSDSGRDWVKSLKVLQVLDNGFIVTGNSPTSGTVFIHKTNQDGIVDDTYLADDPNKYFFYEYIGPYSYTSLGGKRTIHSFRKVDGQVFVNAQAGLKSYFYLQDLFGNVQLFDWADHFEKSYREFGLK